ncbi:hypothetical protein T484DRAFT_1912795, partial [Baffinella frigidus]
MRIRGAAALFLLAVLVVGSGGETGEHTHIRLSSLPICCSRHACLRAPRPSPASKTQHAVSASEQRATRVHTLRGGGGDAPTRGQMVNFVLPKDSSIAHRDVVYDTWTERKRDLEAGRTTERGSEDVYWSVAGSEAGMKAISEDEERLALQARAKRDLREAGDLRPGSRRYSACVRLWAASRFGLEEEIVPALKDGAVVDFPDERYDTALPGCRATHWAADQDEPECLQTLLLSERTPAALRVRPVFSECSRCTSVAASAGSGRACRALIALGADPTLDDEEGYTALERAVMEGNQEAAAVLLEALEQREQSNLEESMIAVGHEMSLLRNRVRAGLPVDPADTARVDDQAKSLALALVARRSSHEPAGMEDGEGEGRGAAAGAEGAGGFWGVGSGGVGSGGGIAEAALDARGETAEERKDRAAAESYLQRGLANSFAEALVQVARTKEADARLFRQAAALSPPRGDRGEQEDTDGDLPLVSTADGRQMVAAGSKVGVGG